MIRAPRAGNFSSKELSAISALENLLDLAIEQRSPLDENVRCRVVVDVADIVYNLSYNSFCKVKTRIIALYGDQGGWRVEFQDQESAVVILEYLP